MPGQKVPADMCSFSEELSFEENYKADSVSSRSSSPKSILETDYSVSESSESPEGSIISEFEIEAERIANDLDNMKITEIQAEEMMKEGADMRHVLQAAWKLKPKITKKFKKGIKLSGKAVVKLLNFEYNDQDAELDRQQRMSRAWAQYEKSLNKRSSIRAPPGFENIDDIIARKSKKSLKQECLVAYANGTNTLNLASEPIIVHDVTMSCMVDSCRGFIQQMKNPTFEGLANLEEEMLTTYSMEPTKELLRPIAHGSVVAVFTDDKWYRCQVVSYCSANDTCDIKFVDHGGYTTVPVSALRQLKADFLRLPFQAIEVYLAGVNRSEQEIQTDIASEILFHNNISIQMLGMADDGVPMVQAYYYDGDYLNTFTQDIIDACMTQIPSEEESSTQEGEEKAASIPESSWATEVEEEEAKGEAVVNNIAPNAAEVVMVPQQHYPTQYYCQETGAYYQTENCQPLVQQPTYAYVCQDQNGVNQVYYVAGPYFIPQPALPTTDLNSPNSDTSSDSGISQGSSNHEDHVCHEEQSSAESGDESNDFINKPFEEWTQEDYARYYGH